MTPKIHFSESEQKIVDILRDRQFHCVYDEIKMKDDRARISSIRRKLQERGFDIESRPCNLHNHSSRLLMRRIVARTDKSMQVQPISMQNPAQMIKDAQTMIREFDNAPVL